MDCGYVGQAARSPFTALSIALNGGALHLVCRGVPEI